MKLRVRSSKKASKRAPKKSKTLETDLPDWILPEAPLGSAVRYLMGSTPRFSRVSIEIARGKKKVAGPSLGQGGKKALTLSVQKDGKVLGWLSVATPSGEALELADRARVESLVTQLGERWLE